VGPALPAPTVSEDRSAGLIAALEQLTFSAPATTDAAALSLSESGSVPPSLLVDPHSAHAECGRSSPPRDPHPPAHGSPGASPPRPRHHTLPLRRPQSQASPNRPRPHAQSLTAAQARVLAQAAEHAQPRPSSPETGPMPSRRAPRALPADGLKPDDAPPPPAAALCSSAMRTIESRQSLSHTLSPSLSQSMAHSLSLSQSLSQSFSQSLALAQGSPPPQRPARSAQQQREAAAARLSGAYKSMQVGSCGSLKSARPQSRMLNTADRPRSPPMPSARGLPPREEPSPDAPASSASYPTPPPIHSPAQSRAKPARPATCAPGHRDRKGKDKSNSSSAYQPIWKWFDV
jgi:hypothetical protein